jgi:hypothetical protein
MHNVPTPAGRPRTVIGHIDGVPQLGDIYDGYGRVHDTVRRIIDICPAGGNTADEIERSRAEITLQVLERNGLTLNARERAAVLRRFPEVVDVEAAHARLVAALQRQGERVRAAGHTTCPRCCATGPADTLGMSDRGGRLRVALCSWCSADVLASATTVDGRRWLR